MVIDDRRHHGDDLHQHLGLAQLAGLDGEAFRRRNGSQAAHQELAPNDDDGHPRRHGARIELHQSDEGGCNQQLVGHRVQQHAHGGHLGALAGEVAVNGIGQGSRNEDKRRQQFAVAVGRAEAAAGQDPDQDRDAEDPGERDVVREVHKRELPHDGAGCRRNSRLSSTA